MVTTKSQLKPGKFTFTKRAIEALKAPTASDRVYHYDAVQANLALCVTTTGAKTFYRYGRAKGRPVRYRLGAWPDMTVENARKAARAYNAAIDRGEDPHETRLAARHQQNLQGLFDYWLEHAKARKKTWQADQWQFQKYLGAWRNRDLAAIHKADVETLHAKLGKDHGHYTANRVLALLRAMFGKADKIGHKGANPCIGVERFAEQSRERFLQTDEMRPFFEAIKAEPAPWTDFWLLCLFTGARRGTIACMAWSDLDLDRGFWLLSGEQTKNKRPVAVVLPPPAVAILRTRQEAIPEAERNDSPYVFPAASKMGHIVDPRKSWARVVEASKIDNLRPHDLRRSLGSWQAIAGASLQVIGASLGHRDHKATQVYSRLTMTPVRQSVDNTVQAMIEAAEPKPAKPVRKVKKGGRKPRSPR